MVLDRLLEREGQGEIIESMVKLASVLLICNYMTLDGVNWLFVYFDQCQIFWIRLSSFSTYLFFFFFFFFFNSYIYICIYI
jgi:hypothetical protein